MKSVCEFCEWLHHTWVRRKNHVVLKRRTHEGASCGFTAAFEKISNGLAFDVDLNQKNIVEKWTRKKVLLKAIKRKFVGKVFPSFCVKKSKENWGKY